MTIMLLILLLTIWLRYFISMDNGRLEGISSTHLGRQCRLPMGVHIHYSGSLYELGWPHGVSCMPWDRGINVRSRCSLVPFILLSA